MTARIIGFSLFAVAVGAALSAGYLHTRISALEQSFLAESREAGVEEKAADVVLLRSMVLAELEGVRGELSALQRQVAAAKGRDPTVLTIQNPPGPDAQRGNILPTEIFSPEAALSGQHSPQTLHPVRDAYAQDAVQNDWSVRTVDQIEAAARADVFFTEAGGDVSSSCGGATCRVEWNFPLSAEESPDERARLMARARYQLLTLTAQNAAHVGPMTSEWVQEGGADVLMVTFARDATLADP
mgnify:CR=1 FL=1